MTTLDTPASSDTPTVSPLARGISKFMRNPTGVAALAIVLVLFVLAFFGPSLAPYDPENYFDYDHLNEGPSSLYWFGVDSLGRDVFSRIIAGTRFSLLSGVAAVLIGAVVGTAAGLAAGWYEGWTDRITMRVSDVLFAFPGVLLAIAIAAILGGGLLNVAAAVAIFTIPSFARLVRGSVLALKHETYVEAARSIGAPDFLILVRHILPGILSVIVVYLTMRIGTAIITASSLSFLGLGAQPPTPEWGAMLNEAREDILTAPHAALFSIGAIFVTVLAFNLLGDALRDALDPKIDE